MSEATLVGSFILWSTLAGIAGAASMALVLCAFTQSGLVRARMILAVGSLITRSYEKAALVGAFVHIAAGVFFGQCYTYIMILIGQPGIGHNLLIGAAIGMLHGLIMSLILIAAVAEVHPLEEFQQRSFAIALSHWVGHVIYGLVVGAVIGASGLVAASLT